MDSALNEIGSVLKQQRLSVPLTLQQLSRKAGVSASHLGRIERGQRFPSARILNKIAAPLGYEENELFMLAGYLTQGSGDTASGYTGKQIDPMVLRLLSQEPIDVQRHVINILNILKSLAKTRNSLQIEDSSGKVKA